MARKNLTRVMTRPDSATGTAPITGAKADVAGAADIVPPTTAENEFMAAKAHTYQDRTKKNCNIDQPRSNVTTFRGSSCQTLTCQHDSGMKGCTQLQKLTPHDAPISL
mmetsp:Transcript_130516/g.260441  ORF Transcript_130516/g.260441 Transcript_130516/m.260441 type:complete len:108 (-) Transcript_130516:802-1125(-)